MNNLSWFIYLTQVVDSLQGVFIFAGIVGILFCLGYTVGCAFASENCSIHAYTRDDHEATAARKADVWVRYRKTLAKVLPAAFVAFVIACIIPSRQTMLLIAGSEMGERAIKSDAVQSVVNPGMDLVKLWIKQETDRITKKAEK